MEYDMQCWGLENIVAGVVRQVAGMTVDE